MRIRSLSVDGFRGLPDKKFDLMDSRTGAAAAIVAVTGPPSMGKTSFLEAIVAAKEEVGPYGAVPTPSDLVRPDTTTAKVGVEWELSNVERERYGLSAPVVESESIFGEKVAADPGHDPALVAILTDYELDPAFGKVEYFHARRKLPFGAPVDLTTAPGATLDKLSRLGRDDTKYHGLIRYVVEAGLGLDVTADGERKPSGRVKQAFETLCHTKILGGLYRTGDAVLPGFFDSEGNAYGVGQLSDSELEALLFAATFVRSGLVANEPGSLILIDRPEAYLDPHAAAAFVQALSSLGENNQLVVATTAEPVAKIARQIVSLG